MKDSLTKADLTACVQLSVSTSKPRLKVSVDAVDDRLNSTVAIAALQNVRCRRPRVRNPFYGRGHEDI